MPARAEGRWTLTVAGRTLPMDLAQNFQQLEGTVTVDGATRRVEQGRLEGDRISFILDPGSGRRTFEGRVSGDRIEPLQSGGDWQAARAD